MSKEKVKGSPRPRYGLWLFLGLGIGVLGVGLAFWAFFEPHRPTVFAEAARLIENQQVFSATYSLDEQKIYAQSGDGHLRIWDASSPNIVPINDLTNQNWNPQWNPAQTQYLGLDYEQAVILFDRADQRITTYEHSGVYMGFWNPTGDRIITVSYTDSRLWTVDGQLLKEFPQPISLTDTAFFWSPDGSRFFAFFDGEEAGYTGLMYDADGNELNSFALDGLPYSYQWNSSSSALATSQTLQSETMSYKIVVYSASGEEMWTDNLANIYGEISWNADGTILSSVNYMSPAEARIYSVDGELLAEIANETFFSWHPSGEFFLVNTPKNRELELIDVHGTVLHTLSHDSDISYSYPQWSPNGEMLASWGRNPSANIYTLYLWDMAGNLLQEMNSSTPINSVLWSPDSSRILTIGDYVARLWSVVDGHEINSLNHNWPILFAQWSSDGRRILSTGSYQNSVAYENAIWTNEGEHLTTLFTGDNTGVYVSAWRSDFSQVLLSSSQGLSVRNLQAGSIYFDFRFGN